MSVHLRCAALSKKTVDVAVEQGSAVIAQVKDNQPVLLAAVQQVESNDQPFERVCQVEQARNRIERREVRLFDAAPVLADLPESSGWPERLAAVIRVQRDTDCFDTRLGDWKRRSETAYYVANHRYSVEVFAEAIRGHWGVENRNHHVRDVTLPEDASRIRRNPGIFARLRSFTLNILRKNQITNVSEALYDNALCLDNLLDYAGVF
jgi:predicted transposase YbfD/YdcC